jgi:hypothetical protein
MTAQLPELFPYLLRQLEDTRDGESNPQLRQITVWTLSRYTQWVLRQQQDDQYLAPLIERILNTMLDHNKKVGHGHMLISLSVSVVV